MHALTGANCLIYSSDKVGYPNQAAGVIMDDNARTELATIERRDAEPIPAFAGGQVPGDSR